MVLEAGDINASMVEVSTDLKRPQSRMCNAKKQLRCAYSIYPTYYLIATTKETITFHFCL